MRKPSTKSDQLRVTEGARRLRAWLKANGYTVHRLCKETGLCRVHMHRILKGKNGRRVTVDFVYAINRVIGDRVIPWDSWRSETARPVRRAA